MSTPPLLNGPQSLYNNVPIQAEFYVPSRFVISDLSLGINTTVTTSDNCNYVIGQLCRLIIPKGYGCTQLNGLTGYVLSLTSDTEVVLSINSVGADPFIDASLPQQPQILAIGDVNDGTVNSSGRRSQSTHIPGSFINIS